MSYLLAAPSKKLSLSIIRWFVALDCLPVFLHPGMGSRPGKVTKTAASRQTTALLATVHDLTMPPG